MIQVIPVRRTYLSIACDWPGCEERIDFPEGPDDEVRNITLLNAAHALGWGACWIHRAREIFERPEGKALLSQWGIDADVEGIGCCVVGQAEHFPSHPQARKEGYIRFV